MYDYYSIVARAVSRLEENTPVARQTLFDRIRTIHMGQLRIRQPLLSKAEILRERKELEDAIGKVELAAVFEARSRQEPACSSSTERAASDHKLVRLQLNEQAAPPDLPSQAKPPPKGVQQTSQTDLAPQSVHRAPPAALFPKSIHRSIELQKSVNEIGPALVARQKSRFQNVFELAREFLAKHVPRGKGTVASRAPVRAPTAIELPYEQAATAPEENSGEIKGILEQGEVNLATGQGPLMENPDGVSEAFDGANSWKPTNLLPMQYLDQLMLDAADPLAPDSLKQDAQTLLRWFNIENREAIKAAHYDRFSRAFQQYLSEWQRPSIEASEPRRPSCTLTDDIRGVFSRLLEREQGAMVFEKALSRFANIWIGQILALNLLGVVGLLLAEPTPWAGITKVAEIYSPFNVWNWTVQVLAVLPGVLAFSWLWGVQDDRLRRLQASSVKLDPVLGLPWHGNALRLRRVRFRWRTFATTSSPKLHPRAP